MSERVLGAVTEEELDVLVSIAIRRAEVLENSDLPGAIDAWREVMVYEERLSEMTPAAEVPGGVARVGAVTAALAAGERVRATELAQKYLSEESLPSERRQAIQRAFHEYRKETAKRDWDRRFLEGAWNGLRSFLRSLSFGGLLGCGVAYLIFLSYPHLFVGRVRLEEIVVFGGLLGACLHRIIDWCLVKPFLFPFGRFIEYYGTLMQLKLQNKAQLIDDDSYKKIKYQLDLAYFLGPTDKVRARKGALPPKAKFSRK